MRRLQKVQSYPPHRQGPIEDEADLLLAFLRLQPGLPKRAGN